jgi:hypothetical protein
VNVALLLYVLPQHSHIIAFGVFGGAKGISDCDDNLSVAVAGSSVGAGAGGAEIELFLICLLEIKCFSICFLLHV